MVHVWHGLHRLRLGGFVRHEHQRLRRNRGFMLQGRVLRRKKDECCELNVGAVIGTAIALLVVLVGSILACCKFCPGCPMNKAAKETEMTKV